MHDLNIAIPVAIWIVTACVLSRLAWLNWRGRSDLSVQGGFLEANRAKGCDPSAPAKRLFIGATLTGVVIGALVLQAAWVAVWIIRDARLNNVGDVIRWYSVIAGVALISYYPIIFLLRSLHFGSNFDPVEPSSFDETERSDVDTDKSKDAESKPRYALLLVHGMGVQDEFQMTAEMRRTLQSGRFTQWETEEIKGFSTQRFVRFGVKKSEDPSVTYELDIHESYWANYFNGLTTSLGSFVFTTKLLLRFLPTVFTANIQKRVREFFQMMVGISLICALLAGAYAVFMKGLFEIQNPKIELRDSVSIAGQWRYYYRTTSQAFSIPGARTTVLDINKEDSQIKSRPQGRTPVELARAYWDAHPYTFLCTILLGISFATVIASILRVIGLAWKWREEQIGSGFLRTAIGRDRDILGDVWSRTTLPILVIMAIQCANQVVYIQTGRTQLLVDPRLALTLFSGGFVYFAYKIAEFWFKNFAGDVQVYAERNANNTWYSARTEAIEQIRKDIKNLIELPLCENDKQSRCYDGVIVVAHSLGSALTLEAIRGLYSKEATRCFDSSGENLHPRCENFIGLVTIGSPLRKFRQWFADDDARSQFQEFNHAIESFVFRDDSETQFESKSSDELAPLPRSVTDRIERGHLDGRKDPGPGLVWINMLFHNDLFADPLRNLQVYVRDKDRSLRDRSSFPVHADVWLKHDGGSRVWTHSNYIGHRGCIGMILETFNLWSGTKHLNGDQFSSAGCGQAVNPPRPDDSPELELELRRNDYTRRVCTITKFQSWMERGSTGKKAEGISGIDATCQLRNSTSWNRSYVVSLRLKNCVDESNKK